VESLGEGMKAGGPCRLFSMHSFLTHIIFPFPLSSPASHPRAYPPLPTAAFNLDHTNYQYQVSPFLQISNQKTNIIRAHSDSNSKTPHYIFPNPTKAIRLKRVYRIGQLLQPTERPPPRCTTTACSSFSFPTPRRLLGTFESCSTSWRANYS